MRSKTLPFVFLLAALFGIVGCQRGGMNGTYSGRAYGIDVITTEFKPGGTVFVTTVAGTTQGTYKVEGDKVVVAANGQNLVFTKSSNGSLTGGPMGVTLEKVK